MVLIPGTTADGWFCLLAGLLKLLLQLVEVVDGRAGSDVEGCPDPIVVNRKVQMTSSVPDQGPRRHQCRAPDLPTVTAY